MESDLTRTGCLPFFWVLVLFLMAPAGAFMRTGVVARKDGALLCFIWSDEQHREQMAKSVMCVCSCEGMCVPACAHHTQA